jgi:5-methylcytosine-specific restriction endonuclease McrA
MQNRFRSVSSGTLIEEFKELLDNERLTVAEIVEYVREIQRRQLYLEHGFTSLFSFLTDGLGYAAGSAQRRIDSARLLDAVPELTENLKSGALNLTQVSMMAHSLRQKKKEDPSVQFSSGDKQALLNKIKNKSTRETEKILAQELNLEIKVQDKQRIQSDESVRLEIAFSKEEMEDFKRVKELISHINPNPSWREVMSYLGKDFVKRRDPRVSKTTSAAEAGPSQNTRFISAEKRRAVFHRDESCRWKCKRTGKICGSKFQEEVDHIKPVWAGGTNEIENLQVLCSVHNQEKYRRESGRSKARQVEFELH